MKIRQTTFWALPWLIYGAVHIPPPSHGSIATGAISSAIVTSLLVLSGAAIVVLIVGHRRHVWNPIPYFIVTFLTLLVWLMGWLFRIGRHWAVDGTISFGDAVTRVGSMMVWGAQELWSDGYYWTAVVLVYLDLIFPVLLVASLFFVRRGSLGSLAKMRGSSSMR